jgi:exopolysaccharide biosynthesis polyprenyl glycosylphosphotransferase
MIGFTGRRDGSPEGPAQSTAAGTAARVAVPESVPNRIGLPRRGVTWALVGSDLVAICAAYALTFAIATAIAPPAILAPSWLMGAAAAVAAPLFVAAFAAYGLYENDRVRIRVASVDEVGTVFHALLVGSLALLLVDQALRRAADWRVATALEAVLFVSSALVLVPLGRAAVRKVVAPRRTGRRRALIVGTGHEARLVAGKLAAHPEYRLEVVGFLSGDGERPAGAMGPVVGAHSDIARVVEDLEIDRVILASQVASHEEMLDLVRTVRRPDLQVSIVPRFCEIFTSHATLDDVQGVPVVTLPPIRLGRSSGLLKRSFDLVVAGAILVLLAPVLALIALAVRLDSPGPAIYRQPRRGRAGSTFRIFKFRTMSVGAEARRAEVLHLNEVDGPLFKVKRGSDPRVTRVGRFLRRTSLDELPQLFNVLRGDMSLVGPRPFVLYEADQITGWAARRLDMAPGMTGLWQVLGRNDLAFEEMTKLDYLYVTNWSLWWDLKILVQTVPVVLRRSGAY